MEANYIIEGDNNCAQNVTEYDDEDTYYKTLMHSLAVNAERLCEVAQTKLTYKK
jgi:hypothetical protein